MKPNDQIPRTLTAQSPEIRELDPSDLAETASLNTHILGLPRDIKTAGLVVVNGQGEPWRTTLPVQWWNERKRGYSHLIPTGAGIGEETGRLFDIPDLVTHFGLLRTNNVHVQGYLVPDTRDHARWVVGKLCELDLSTATVCASLYHLPRVFRTILKELMRNGLERKIPIYPVPIPVSPSLISPETNVPMSDLMIGEIRRCIIYSEKGDIATLPECMGYIEWLWEQLSSQQTELWISEN